jgi:hypothetical protein
VLASGLGNAPLAPMVSLHAPVRPQAGGVVVLERVRRFLELPVATMRQTDGHGADRAIRWRRKGSTIRSTCRSFP